MSTSTGTTTVSADSTSPSTSAAAPNQSREFGRAAMAILATMVLLIVALTGVLVETTWNNPQGTVEELPGDPGSFARR
ncbi:MAG TPA: hypothetical protein VE399_06630 [Gemmatimonadales bacterium]|nr:hypothetical protein [Gemmatimonadales bacterium]